MLSANFDTHFDPPNEYTDEECCPHGLPHADLCAGLVCADCRYDARLDAGDDL